MFSNLSEEIQRAIESQPYLISSLLANSDQQLSYLGLPNLSTVEGLTNDFSIRQNSLTEESSFVSETTTSTAQVSSSQISFTQVGSTQVGSTQVGSAQVGSAQVGSTQVGSAQVGSHQSRSTQIDLAQVSPHQQSLTQINSIQVNASQILFDQTYSREISDTLSILLNESLRVHNDASSIANAEHNAISHHQSYMTFLDTSKVNFVLRDLPTGQLAEASITDYDSSGRPNTGTLTLDLNGNSLGWFIDSTPFDNSEFAQSLTSSVFKATQGSAAYGHYDLLTTILHELGHLAGIISGNSNYDQHIQTINGSPVFIGDGFTAQLTPDGSHLDSRYYPYDLMNTHLAPGVRKLPSTLDLQILSAIALGRLGRRNPTFSYLIVFYVMNAIDVLFQIMMTQ